MVMFASSTVRDVLEKLAVCACVCVCMYACMHACIYKLQGISMMGDWH